MRKRQHVITGPLLALIALVTPAWGEFPAPRPYEPVRYFLQQQSNPPQKIHVVAVDLSDKRVSVHVSRGGEDPDGKGEWQTTLQQPSRIAAREEYEITVNGDFFAHFRGKDAEGPEALKMFKGGIPAKVSGPAVTDGELWGPAGEPRACLLIGANGRPAVAMVKTPPRDAKQVIAGSNIIVKGGRNVAPPSDKPGFARGPHPRTAVGIAAGGKALILVVADGRDKENAVGLSLTELADIMLKYGCTDAVNLDGGGSSALVMRNPDDGKQTVLNNPSDGRERAVANVLGIDIKGVAGEKK
jgi:exopolysaccharide biosynthesis protein